MNDIADSDIQKGGEILIYRRNLTKFWQTIKVLQMSNKVIFNQFSKLIVPQFRWIWFSQFYIDSGYFQGSLVLCCIFNNWFSTKNKLQREVRFSAGIWRSPLMQFLPQVLELKATTSNALSEFLMCRILDISYPDALPVVLIIGSQYMVRVPLRSWSVIVNLCNGV